MAPCVLIVGDDAGAADLFGMWLRDAGHRVSIVEDATSALILAPVLHPTVIVIDIGLLGTEGLGLARRLRALPELAYCRCVAVAAHANSSLPVRCRAAGFADFLEKPTCRLELVKSVCAAAGLDQRTRFN